MIPLIFGYFLNIYLLDPQSSLTIEIQYTGPEDLLMVVIILRNIFGDMPPPPTAFFISHIEYHVDLSFICNYRAVK